MGRAVNQRRLMATGFVLGSGTLLALGGWLLWSMGGGGNATLPGSRAEVVSGSELSGIPGIQAAEVAPALLADFYEHDNEHVPPRQPGGVMQRRERFYTPPHDPFFLLTSKLGQSPADAALQKQLTTLQGLWEKSAQIPGDARAELEALLGQSSLKAEPLIEAGRSFAFLSGDELAALFYRAGLERAQQQYHRARAGDPATLPLLRQLDQTKALQRLRDYRALEKRFALEMALYPPLSVEARRAGCLYAEALMKQSRAVEAAEAIVGVFEQDKAAGDLGLKDPSDLGEMDWRAGTYLARCGRCQDAIPYLQDLLKTNDNRKQKGVQLWIACLHRLGRDSEAETLRERYKLGSPGSAAPTTRPTASLSMHGGVCVLKPAAAAVAAVDRPFMEE